jgi:hypothetical protein
MGKNGDVKKDFLEFYVDKSNDSASNYTAMYIKRLEGGKLVFAEPKEVFSPENDTQEETIREELRSKLIKTRLKDDELIKEEENRTLKKRAELNALRKQIKEETEAIVQQ